MESAAEFAGWAFGWLLRNSAHAAVLVLVVALAEALVGRYLTPRWRYGLWLLVVARLLIPIAPGSFLSLYNLVDLAPGALAGLALELLGLPVPLSVAHLDPPNPLADTPPWFLGALALWLPGALVLAGVLARDHFRLLRALDHTVPVIDPETVALLRQSRAVMGVRRHVALVETPGVSSPAIAGWWRPRLLLPPGLLARLSPDETRFLFLHELAHVKRADLALNWVLAAVQILHWFNPVVWFALRRLLSVREEVCDDLVLRRCFQGAAREYGLTLLRLLEECAPRRLVPALAGILDDLRALRSRMRCIRTFHHVDARPWFPATLTLTLAIAGLTDHRDRHPLFSSAPTLAEIQAQKPARPRSRTAPASLRHSTPPPVDAPPAPRRTPPVNLLSTLTLALQRTFADRGNSSRPPASPALSGSPVPTPSRPVAFPRETSGLMTPRLGTTPALPAASRTPSPAHPAGAARRPYPLPPVSQRGDVLRPPGSSPTANPPFPTGRVLGAAPSPGSSPDLPPTRSRRRNG